MKEFKLKPDEIMVIGRVTLGNFSTQSKWYVAIEKEGDLLIANVKRPEHITAFTLEEPERHRTDLI